MAKSRFPHPLVLIFVMIVVAQIATYFLPAGEFERDGRKVLQGTYHLVEAKPLPAFSFLLLIPKGLQAGAEIIFFVFVVGGVIGVIRATGAIDAMIGAAIGRLGGRPIFLVFGLMTLFAVGSSTIGMAEEYMPFIPILVTMCLALKMDAIVAMGIVYIASGVGYGCAALNPFTVMIAQDIAGVPQTSGQLFRWSLLAVCLAVGVHHVMRYAKRIHLDSGKSLVVDIDYSSGFEFPENIRFSWRRALILFLCVAGLAVFVYGVKELDWYLVELAAIFLGIGILSGLIGGLGANRTASDFCQGAAEMTTTALLIGFARTIEVVLSEGKVIDTVIYEIAGPLGEFGAEGAALGMLGVQSVCNFFIPSGSGQAYVTMPILAPMADLVGISREASVLAYQFGDGFTNMVVPTNALLMGMLTLARIPFGRWLRFILPLLLKLYLVAMIALVLVVRFDWL
ncbi:MAG: YfcC family protein [Planctomycetota bacterium]|nr:MAG: YfcC family protein [Planctomycetota bacterium]